MDLATMDLSKMVRGQAVVSEDDRLRDEWLHRRRGRFTASRFGDLMVSGRAKGELFGTTALSYIDQVIGERIGSFRFSFESAPTSWGKDNEADAITEYEKRTGVSVDRDPYRFIELGNYAGATPDGLVGDDGGVEVKCPYSPGEHVATLRTRQVPKQYKYQVDGSLLVTGRTWWDFVSYDPRIDGPLSLIIIRVTRDETDLESLHNRILSANRLANEVVGQLEVLR